MFLFGCSNCASGLLNLTGDKIEQNLSCPIRKKNITHSKLLIVMKHLKLL